jgi:hypothetical protein
MRRSAATLKSGRSGKKVTSRKQAVAIGLSEARKEGAKVPAKKSSIEEEVADQGSLAALERFDGSKLASPGLRCWIPGRVSARGLFLLPSSRTLHVAEHPRSFFAQVRARVFAPAGRPHAGVVSAPGRPLHAGIYGGAAASLADRNLQTSGAGRGGHHYGRREARCGRSDHLCRSAAAARGDGTRFRVSGRRRTGDSPSRCATQRRSARCRPRAPANWPMWAKRFSGWSRISNGDWG